MTYDVGVTTSINYKAHGMKPNTIHKLYILDIDIGAAVTPKNGMQGDPIITDSLGKCEFTYSQAAAGSFVRTTTGLQRNSLWQMIQDEIFKRTGKLKPGQDHLGYDNIYETILKNTEGDSKAKGSFSFKSQGTKNYQNGVEVDVSYHPGSEDGPDGWTYTPVGSGSSSGGGGSSSSGGWGS